MRFLRCLRNIFSNVSLSFSFLFLSGIYIQYTRFLSAKKINTEHFFGLCPDIWLIFDNNGKPSICSHFRLCRKNIFSASFVDFFCNLSILRKKGVILVKIPHTQGDVACNTYRNRYLKPTQPSRLGLPLALWFVRIQARCHLCSHNSTWKSFRVAAASGHLTGTAYGQAVKP